MYNASMKQQLRALQLYNLSLNLEKDNIAKIIINNFLVALKDLSKPMDGGVAGSLIGLYRKNFVTTGSYGEYSDFEYDGRTIPYLINTGVYKKMVQVYQLLPFAGVLTSKMVYSFLTLEDAITFNKQCLFASGIIKPKEEL